MKTYRNLYPEIAGFANLDEAWRKARRGKRGKEAAARFEENAEGDVPPHVGSDAVRQSKAAL